MTGGYVCVTHLSFVCATLISLIAVSGYLLHHPGGDVCVTHLSFVCATLISLIAVSGYLLHHPGGDVCITHHTLCMCHSNITHQ